MVALLATLVWLAGRYEVSQVVAEVESDAADAVADLRGQMTIQAQALQAVHFRSNALAPLGSSTRGGRGIFRG